MVKSLGGIFLYSENPKLLADWYSSHFGLEYEYTENHEAYYVTFPYREMDAETRRYSIFSILYNRHRPFVDGKVFTINLRVENLIGIISRLSANNIAVRGPEFHEEGTFAWLNDLEGNYIELWEERI